VTFPAGWWPAFARARLASVPRFDPAQATAALYRDGTSDLLTPTGRPMRVDGYVVGFARMSANPPHRGELHPDGDELLYLLSGRVAVVEDDGDAATVGVERREVVEAGEAYVVPQGVWHRVEVLEPCELLHITPGPGDGHRPLEDPPT
jgi:mannose-6-phosphate isomerase-like protein (cupin superfamily)